MKLGVKVPSGAGKGRIMGSSLRLWVDAARSLSEEVGVGPLAGVVPEDESSAVARFLLASSAAIRSVNLLASRIASPIASSALLTVLWCSDLTSDVAAEI